MASLLEAAGSKEEEEEEENEERKKERGIYRSWIMKVMQINKGEGVFVKVGRHGAPLLTTWPVVMMRGSGDIKEKTFGREAFNEERERKDKRMMHSI